jgi:hypothetical protein
VYCSSFCGREIRDFDSQVIDDFCIAWQMGPGDVNCDILYLITDALLVFEVYDRVLNLIFVATVTTCKMYCKFQHKLCAWEFIYGI